MNDSHLGPRNTFVVLMELRSIDIVVVDSDDSW